MSHIGGRLGIWREVVWRPALAVVGGIYAAAAAFVFVRDAALPALLSPKDAKTWQANLAPQFHFDWYWWVIGILVALLVVVLEGVFRVVQKERAEFTTEREALQAQIHKENTPDLIGKIDQIIGATSPAELNVLKIFINMSIRNLGEATFVDSFLAFVTVGGARRSVDLFVIDDNTTISGIVERTIRLTAADAIYEKGTARLERGDQIHGWLQLKVPGVRGEDFFRPGNLAEISFADYLGKTYVASVGTTGVRGDFQYIPGSQDVRFMPPLKHSKGHKK